MPANDSNQTPPTPEVSRPNQERQEQLVLDSELRITELETRVAFQEDLLNTLNDVIAKQDQLLSKLTRKIDHLEEQQRQNGYAADGGNGGGDGLAHEPPPHY